MVIEIVTTGTELLLGQIVNTNSAYLAAELNKLGFDVLYQTTVGDNRIRMTEVIEVALKRADMVITSGGLGPTQGDITKFVSADIFGLKTSLHQPSLDNIKEIFQKRNIPLTENNIRQAMIPEGATVFHNACGTAPGVVMEHEGKVIVNLPGPPSELKDMFTRSLVPYLHEKYGFQSVIVSRVLNTFGIGESLLEEKIKDLILTQSNPTLALLARKDEVIIRVTAKADTKDAAYNLIAERETEIRHRVGQFIFAVDDGDMEDVVGKMLVEKNLKIACAESCTGGHVTSRLTDVAGSSRYVYGSVVSYTDEVKISELGVPKKILEKHGAVSEETAIAMAQGIVNKFKTDIGLSITGIAGPGGGTAEKPVGLVYIAVTGKLGTKVYKNQFGGTRKYIKHRTSQAALDYVRIYLKEL